MKGYGLPRTTDIEFPDLVDLAQYGLKSSRGRGKSKGGDIKNSVRNSATKRRTRRIWKRLERLDAKTQCRETFE